MSRSYKKSPVFVLAGGFGSYGKRLANKKLRRYREYVPRGNWWKRLFDSYSIVDLMWRMPDAPKKAMSK